MTITRVGHSFFLVVSSHQEITVSFDQLAEYISVISSVRKKSQKLK
jgi:hypothetical protein